MSILTKIEDLKAKPEHIRIRYVWISVLVSMFFIVIIWFFSMQSRVSSTTGADAKTTDDLQKQFEQIKNSTPSIDDLMKTTNPAGQNPNSNPGAVQNQNTPDQSQAAAPDKNNNQGTNSTSQDVKGEDSANNTFPIAQ